MGLLFGKKQGEPVVQPPDDPYRAARDEFNEVNGDRVVQARNWRAAFLAVAVSLVISVSVNAYVSTKSRFVPYIVEIDKIGNVAAVAMADKGDVKDERVIRAFLLRFMTDARRVTYDPTLQKEAVNRVFAMLANNTVASAKMSEYYAANSPFVRGQTESVSAEISSILRIGEKSWQVAWVETTRDPQGQVRNQTQWTSTLTLAFNEPTDEAQILVNPLGLFITDFDWRQELAK